MATPDSDVQFEKRRKEKEISLARSTVESYMKSILPQAGLTYHLDTTDNGILLRIKMSHGRMLRMRFNQRNYMQMLEKALPSIKVIIEAFDKIGKTNAFVTGCSYSINWQYPENEQDEFLA